jgi:hypothetical protein
MPDRRPMEQVLTGHPSGPIARRLRFSQSGQVTASSWVRSRRPRTALTGSTHPDTTLEMGSEVWQRGAVGGLSALTAHGDLRQFIVS